MGVVVFFKDSGELYSFQRLRPEELNTSILNYMTESLGYGLSDVIHTVINNRPSTIMSSYHLLLKKLLREQRGAKTTKVHTHTHIHTHAHTHLCIGFQVVVKDIDRDGEVTGVEGILPVPTLRPKLASLGNTSMEVTQGEENGLKLLLTRAVVQDVLHTHTHKHKHKHTQITASALGGAGNK